jgi:hypothetical protein
MSFRASTANPVFIPLRRFAGEIGRSRQFLYSEMKLSRLKTILHGGRRFVHHAERDRYVAAVIAASPDYGAPTSAGQQFPIARSRSFESRSSRSGLSVSENPTGSRPSPNSTTGRTLDK